jgi:pantoate--beta-alanine ligase
MLILDKRIYNRHCCCEYVSRCLLVGSSDTLTSPVLKDLLLAHPSSETLHILPTTRDPFTNLALSSRNAYLSPAELKVAPTLYQALASARDMYQSVVSGPARRPITGEEMISVAAEVVSEVVGKLRIDGSAVQVQLDYIELFNRDTFAPIRGEVPVGTEMVVAGAMWVGRTRLIDNLLLGWETS